MTDENKQQEVTTALNKQPSKCCSMMQRFVTKNRDRFQSFYATKELDDHEYGEGFNDTIDEFVPAVVVNEAERRAQQATGSKDGCKKRSEFMNKVVASLKVSY